VAQRPTIDLDPTDVEVYGPKKEGSGRDDPRPQAPSLIARAVAGLPEGLGRPRVRADSGFFDKAVAEAALDNGADFAVAVKRNPAVWRAARAVPVGEWRAAKAMRGAEVAVCGYRPEGWPEDARCIVRRVRLDADDVRADPRSRRRRTIDPDQLRLVLDGEADHAYAYSFVVTNLDGDVVEVEAWFRERARVEERIKDSKCGLALRHLPSGYDGVNVVWMWAAFLALNLSAWTQAMAGIDTDGRAHAKRARRELFVVPARVLQHADASCCASPRPVVGERCSPPGPRCAPFPPPAPEPGRTTPAAATTPPPEATESQTMPGRTRPACRSGGRPHPCPPNESRRRIRDRPHHQLTDLGLSRRCSWWREPATGDRFPPGTCCCCVDDIRARCRRGRM
jgi:hypothetical protein